ncbi:tektin-3 isoform X5 [Eurytemora carolleeae]|uniref:tektin-3 isoform X5 n=1 Tax=Eurytemora carolleeae TaxID=1294199 RepID=UPI000C780C6C|nr:tektin-3 isoform X5 [Eurytemora carolleeae]|eukprot:XP_023328113.1 tektin-3-like isoform X5 [Eurytemora affinis]
MSHTHEEWSESNLNHYQSAHSSRTKSERIRNEADTLMANCASKTQRSQQEANNRLGSRIEDCNSWRADLQTELDNNIRENGLLKETKAELEHAIAETERPLRINNECIKNREARISIDLVKDEVENSLEREVENIKTYQQRMQKMLGKVNQQIETNHSMQDKLHADLEHKDMALEIDRDCHEMHNDAIDIKHHDGVEEEDVSGSVPQSWAKFSKNNVEESQAAGRSATRQLRYDVNNLINNAASDMSVHWNKTNRSFTDRISETQDAHRNLKSNLILTKNEIGDLQRYIERLRRSLYDKDNQSIN